MILVDEGDVYIMLSSLNRCSSSTTRTRTKIILLLLVLVLQSYSLLIPIVESMSRARGIRLRVAREREKVTTKTLLKKENSLTYGGVRPQAIEHDGMIYYTYFEYSTNYLYIRAYQISQRKWSNEYHFDNTSAANNHRSPLINVLPNGKLIVIYDMHDNEMRWRISKYTNDQIKENITKISEWSGEYTRDGQYTYPQTIYFDDKLVIFVRNGTATSGGWVKLTTTDGVNLTSEVAVGETLSDGTYYFWFRSARARTYYFWFRRIRNYIFMTGNRYNYSKTQPKRYNIYFAYSDDKGETWRSANGTSLSSPLGENAKIIISSYQTSSVGACLDENNKPIIIVGYLPETYVYYGNVQVQVATYNNTLGSPGSWTINNVTVDGSNLITGVLRQSGDVVDIFLGHDENRPVFYTKQKLGSYWHIRRYVRQSEQTYAFDVSYTDYNQTATSSDETNCPVMIHKTTSSLFEVMSTYKIGSDRSIYILGKLRACASARRTCYWLNTYGMKEKHGFRE